MDEEWHALPFDLTPAFRSLLFPTHLLDTSHTLTTHIKMPASLVHFSKNVSKLPELPTISEKVNLAALEDAMDQEFKAEERSQMIQALLLDACLTFGAYLIQVSGSQSPLAPC